MKSNKLSETVVFFGKQHVKQVIKCSNINSAPGPDRITLDLIENGGDLLALCLTRLMQPCYFVGYFPRLWKMENRTYLKKPDKEHYHQENSLSNFTFTHSRKDFQKNNLKKQYFRRKNFFQREKKCLCIS